MKTRAQEDLELAARLVREVESMYPDINAKERVTFGGLCHTFPIMVRTCGLCQSLAFSVDKSTARAGQPLTPRNTAHQLLLNHVGQLLAVNGTDQLLASVRDCRIEQYMFDTRRVLAAWVYWKRFAVSILKVDSASGAEDPEDA